MRLLFEDSELPLFGNLAGLGDLRFWPRGYLHRNFIILVEALVLIPLVNPRIVEEKLSKLEPLVKVLILTTAVLKSKIVRLRRARFLLRPKLEEAPTERPLGLVLLENVHDHHFLSLLPLVSFQVFLGRASIWDLFVHHQKEIWVLVRGVWFMH